MKKLSALLSGALLALVVFQASPALAGDGCSSKCAKPAKMACGEHVGPMTCVVDGKTVACTKNADGTCSLPAGTADAAAIKAGTTEVKIGEKTVKAKVNADGSLVLACEPGSCHDKPAACDMDAKGAKKSKKAKAEKKQDRN
jgi:hypothetical protein